MIRKLLSKLSFNIVLNVPPADRITSWQYILLGLFILFGCYYGMSSYAILDMNEGLYAEVAREILANHHYLIPFLNGVPYLEKPPLLYWLLALSYRAFGDNAFAARLIPSTATALTCLSMVYFGKKLQMPRVGWISAVVLLTSLVFLIIGRVVFFDMLFTLLISATMFSFFLWYQENKSFYLYNIYLFLGLSVLTKGFLPLAILPLIIISFLFLTRAGKDRYKALFDKKAIILFLIVVLPWHLLAILWQPGFTWEYMINNQFLRFFNQRIPHDYHTGPIYYYVIRIFAYLLPWTAIFPFLFYKPLRLQNQLSPLKIFLWLWLVIFFLFFTLSANKGEYYLVVATPALAYLLGLKIDEWFTAGKGRILGAIFACIALLEFSASIIALVFYRTTKRGFSEQNSDLIPAVLTNSLIIASVILCIYTIIGIYYCYRNQDKPIYAFILLSGLIIPLLWLFIVIKEKTQPSYSQIALAQYVKAQYQYRPVYLYQDFEAVSSFVFYNKEPSIIVDSQSQDLYFGSKSKEAEGKFISLQKFLEDAKQKPVYLIVLTNKLAGFQKQADKNDFCTVQRNGNVLLLSNSAEDCKPITQMGSQKDLLGLDNLIKNDNKKSEMPKES